MAYLLITCREFDFRWDKKTVEKAYFLQFFIYIFLGVNELFGGIGFREKSFQWWLLFGGDI